jgi:hypothetical protein
MDNDMISDFMITDTPSNVSSSVSSTMPSMSFPSETVSSGYNINWSSIVRYSLIILILAFLGLNLFAYLGKITEETAGFLKPILGFLGYGATTTIKQTVDVSAQGAKGLVDVAAGTVTSGVELLEKGIGSKGQLRNKIDDTSNVDDVLSKAEIRNARSVNNEPVPDDAGSRTQSNRSVGKSGFCYIGEDRGFRSCIKVGEADMCMSGDIFPSQEICINPNLRE